MQYVLCTMYCSSSPFPLMSFQDRRVSSDPSPPTTSLKSCTTDTRGLGRSTEMVTGGIANQNESAVTKAEELVDAASDELYLDSDVSADNEYWHQIAIGPCGTAFKDSVGWR